MRLHHAATAILAIILIIWSATAIAQGVNEPAGFDGNATGEPAPAALVNCAPGDLCGLLGPYANTHWIADGEWEPTLDLFGFVSVDATTSRIIVVDPNTCGEVFACDPAFATSYRAFAWGTQGGDMWVSGWNPPVQLFHFDLTCGLIAQFDVGIEIAGLAMDFANGHLWAMQRSPVGGPNSALWEYDVTTGTPVLIQGPITVNWGGTTPGIGSAGLEYDNSNCSIVALRQDSNNVGRSSIVVFFDLDPGGAGGVLWLASCDIVTTQFCQGAGTFINHPWGIAVRDTGPTDRRVVITDIDLIDACAIPPAGGGPIDLHYYAVPPSLAFCLTTAVEPTTWGQIKTMHKR